MTATPSADIRADKQAGSFSKDLTAGIVLLLVALPLNLGVALASGVPAEYGVISGVIGSLVTGLLSGSPLQVSGPDAGIGVLVLEMVNSCGLRYLGPIVFVAGAVQVAASFLRTARWFRTVCPAVVNGMLAGMGLLIVVTQFHIMLDDTPKDNGLANLLLIPAAIWKGIITTDGSASHHLAAFIGSLTILIAVVWTRYSPPRLKMIPAALVSIVTATLLTALLQLPIQSVTLPEDIGSSLAPITIAGIMEVVTNQSLLLAALTLAFVASAQSLITASATDSISGQGRTSYDRELFAQGVGNALCGLLGVLPIAGVLVRSMANIQCGAKTRKANLMHGVLMLIAVLTAPGLLQLVPTSALAAVLVLIGCRMVAGICNAVRNYERAELMIFAGTMAAIMVTNLFTGVIIGFALALFRLMYVLLHLDVEVNADSDNDRITINLRGAATFLNLPRLEAVLDAVPDNCQLHIRLDELTYIDHSCLELLLTWERKHRNSLKRLAIDWGPMDAVLQNAARAIPKTVTPHPVSVRIQPRPRRTRVC